MKAEPGSNAERTIIPPAIEANFTVAPLPIIEVQNLAKSYGQVLGLTDVNLTIPSGITGLLGPNGAGKSTFLKLILGLLHPTLGQINILGESPRNIDIFSRIGYVPEHDCLTSNLTGVSYLTFQMQMQGLPKSKAPARARVLLRRLEVADEAMDRKLGTYSRGMRQKVKLARALGHDPQLLILDEPFQGTDPSARRLIMENIRQWSDKGKSVLISSHILQDIEALTDSIVLINNGRIIAHGHRRTIREMVEHIPQRVVITPRDPKEQRRLAHNLLSLPSVSKIALLGHPSQIKDPPRVEIQTHSSRYFYRELPHLLVEEGIMASEVVSPDDNLETLYTYLVGGAQWRS